MLHEFTNKFLHVPSFNFLEEDHKDRAQELNAECICNLDYMGVYCSKHLERVPCSRFINSLIYFVDFLKSDLTPQN